MTTPDQHCLTFDAPIEEFRDDCARLRQGERVWRPVSRDGNITREEDLAGDLTRQNTGGHPCAGSTPAPGLLDNPIAALVAWLVGEG